MAKRSMPLLLLCFTIKIFLWCILAWIGWFAASFRLMYCSGSSSKDLKCIPCEQGLLEMVNWEMISSVGQIEWTVICGFVRLKRATHFFFLNVRFRLCSATWLTDWSCLELKIWGRWFCSPSLNFLSLRVSQQTCLVVFSSPYDLVVKFVLCVRIKGSALGTCRR